MALRGSRAEEATGPDASAELQKFLASAPWYASADSVPEGYAVARSPWLVFAFLLVYALVVVALLQSATPIERGYSEALSRLVARDVAPDLVPIRLRTMFLAMLATFPLFLEGPLSRRLQVASGAAAAFVLVALAVDATTVAFGAPQRMASLLITGNLLVGFAAMAIFGASLLRACRLPRDQVVESRREVRWAGLKIVAVAAVVALLATQLAVVLGGSVLDRLRSFALLGGLGPGVVLFMPLFTASLAVIGIRHTRPPARSAREEVMLPVAILVPAYNEEHGIAQCIEHLDAAAGRYAGTTTLYLVDNASRDATARVAREAIAACTHLRGSVLTCEQPGKSKALNYGLSKISEPVVVRVDADTLVSRRALHDCLKHFTDPTVGAAGGVPLPLHEDSLLSRMRAIEVYLTHGYGRLGLAAVDGLLSIPGIFSAYRRDCLIALGGFAEGMNGEDSDIVLRIGRLGFRLVNDPRIEVFSEAPESYAHLREQRLRWFRSTFHVAAKNWSAVSMRQGIRGVWSLPWAVVQAARRAMILPILIYAALVAIVDPGALHLRGGAAILAVLVGSASIVAATVLLGYRRYRLLLDLPAYAGFRLMRSFFTLETLFTLPLRAPRSAGKGPESS